jgi:hypothetical protein
MIDNTPECSQRPSKRMGIGSSTVKVFLLALSLGTVAGMVAGGGAAIGYHRAWRTTFVSVVKDIQFLIRENDARSAEAVLEEHVPYFDRQITGDQLSRLAEELRRAARRHAE